MERPVCVGETKSNRIKIAKSSLHILKIFPPVFISYGLGPSWCVFDLSLNGFEDGPKLMESF